MEKHIERFRRFLVAERNASENTVAGYLKDIQQFRLYLEERRPGLSVEGVDAAAVRGFLSVCHLKKFSGSTLERKLAALRCFFRFLCREKVLRKNPARGIPAAKKEKNIPVVVPVDDIFRLMESSEGDGILALRNKAMLELFYASGLRISELVSLNRQDMDFTGRLLRVKGKGNKERIVPFGTKAREALEAYGVKAETWAKRPRDEKALFLNKDGRRIGVRGVRKIVEARLRRTNPATTWSLYMRRIFLAPCFITVFPTLTCPSPATATFPWCRTARMVVALNTFSMEMFSFP